VLAKHLFVMNEPMPQEIAEFVHFGKGLFATCLSGPGTGFISHAANVVQTITLNQ